MKQANEVTEAYALCRANDISAGQYYSPLKGLRESGGIKMSAAPTWLATNYGLSKEEANAVFTLWIVEGLGNEQFFI